MSKSFLYVTGLILLSSISYAQVILPKDEQGKITYLDVVKIDSTTRDSLYRGVVKWAKRNYGKTNVEADSVNGIVKVPGSFLVYINPGVLKELNGAISYDLTIEIKDNRYRYIFTNFVYEYYKQQRSDYKYVPTGKTKPLEDETAPGWNNAWKKHKISTDEHVKREIGSLKHYLTVKELQEKILNTPVKKNQDW